MCVIFCLEMLMLLLVMFSSMLLLVSGWLVMYIWVFLGENVVVFLIH